MVDYTAKPFHLTEEDISWVETTLDQMSLEEKIGQLFCLTGAMTDPEELQALIGRWRPGAFMYRAGNARDIQRACRVMNEASPIPMLLPCNLESGGNGISTEGTYFSRPLGVAATDDGVQARRLGLVCAREGAAAGCNWAFAPIADLDRNWRNPITNVRTFGSDTDKVIAMAGQFMEGVAEASRPMAVCIKHFPGDGVDERDQHLLPTVNSLSVREWMESYGKVYRALIDKGAQTVMCGHILQPALEKMLDPGMDEADMRPCSQSRRLIEGVLRGTLGFNGLVTTDATPMVGFSALSSRKEALQQAIAAGADMLLFCKDLEEDYGAIREGIENGVISPARIDEAVSRQLALKASLGLHRPVKTLGEDALAVIGCEEHRQWAAECAHKAVTLVKDNQRLLPISPKTMPHIRLTVVGEGEEKGFGESGAVAELLEQALREAGFAVSLYDYATMEHGEIFSAGVSDMKGKFDLSIVAANVNTASNYSSRRIDWVPLMAANAPWYTRDIPTLFVSFCNPYHMIDVPFISTFINCYSANEFTVQALVDKLTGKEPFWGENPVDPWCGAWGAQFM